MTAKEAIKMLMDQLQYYVNHDKNEKYIQRMQEAINALLVLYHGSADLQTQKHKQDETIDELQRRYKKLMQILRADPNLLRLPTWYLDSIGDVPMSVRNMIWRYDAIIGELCSLEDIGQFYASTKEEQAAEQLGTEKYQELSNILELLYQLYTQTIQNIYTLCSYLDSHPGYVLGQIEAITNKYQVYYHR